MSTSVRIVADSACDLPEEVCKQEEIRIVPLSVRFGEQEFVDRVELSNDEFWTRMAASSTLPQTAAPSPGAFEEAFREAIADGCRTVICINISSKLSATYQAAVTAARFVNDKIAVHVIDSKMVTLGHGSLCLEATRLASEGTDGDNIVSKVEQLRDRLQLYGTFDTLENLKKGGRIGKAQAFAGALLNVKPIVAMRDGELEPMSRQRTRARALESLAELAVKQAPIDHVYVAHSAPHDVDRFIDLLAPAVKREDVTVAPMGPVIGTHGGPGVIAVSFATSSSSAG